MSEFRLRTDLQRVVIGASPTGGGFALPLGIAPSLAHMRAPIQGYTVSFVPGEDDEPDTYSFHVVVSHERLQPIVLEAMNFLPEEVFGIIEIGSRDAYRATDTFISVDVIARDTFLHVWRKYEPFLLEDSSIGAGANSEEPFVEVFLDQWKGLAIHVPPSLRDDVEAMLGRFNLEEVIQTWPDDDEFDDKSSASAGLTGDGELFNESSQVRSVLDLSHEESPDVDELLLDLRHELNLELNVDPEGNVDDSGRDLGSTLWHAVVIVDPRATAKTAAAALSASQGAAGSGNGNRYPSGFASIWATAASLNQMEELIRGALRDNRDWAFGEIYTIDRVAFDERPDELTNLRPNERQPQVHLVTIEALDDLPGEPPRPQPQE